MTVLHGAPLRRLCALHDCVYVAVVHSFVCVLLRTGYQLAPMDLFLDFEITDGDQAGDAHICRGDMDVPPLSLARRAADAGFDTVVPLWDRDGAVECGEIVVKVVVRRTVWHH